MFAKAALLICAPEASARRENGGKLRVLAAGALAMVIATGAPAATTLTIGTTADLNGDSILGDDVLGSLALGDNAGANSKITAVAVGTLLTLTDLSLVATSDVTVNSAVSWAGFRELQLNSSGTLNINAGITNTGTGSLRLVSADAMALAATLSVREIVLANEGALTQTAGTLTASSFLQLGGGGDVGTLGTPVAINTPELEVSKTGGSVYLSNAGALDFDYVTTSGNLSVIANGAITSSSVNPMSVTGTLTVAAGATHDVTLGNASNDFGTVAITSGKDAIVVDANALDLGASTVSGDLNVTTGGAITQSGAVSVTGATTLAAGSTHDITLANGSNDFSTVTITSGGNVSLADATDLDLHASTIAGTLTLSAATINLDGAIAPTSIIVNAGTLTPSTNDLIGDSTGLNLAGTGASFDLTDLSDVVGWISGVAGTTIELGTTGALATTGNASTTFAGMLDGGTDTSFTKGGTGTLTLSGNNSFAGTLTANSGTIALAATGSRGSGEWTFNNSAVLKLSVAGALDDGATGATLFYDSAKLSAQALGSITGGTQVFYNSSSLQVSASGGLTTGDGVITGGEQDFHDSTLLKAGVTNSISGGTQYFDGTAVLTASGDHAITGGTQNFTTMLTLFDEENPFVLSQTSRLVINGGGNDAIAGGTQNFSGYSSIQANRSNAIAGGTQNFSDYSHLRASQPDAVIGGEQHFTDSAYLWPTATNAVVGVTLDLKGESYINIGATDALDATTNINFNGCADGTGGTLLLNGYNTIVGMIASVNGDSAGLIQNGAETNANLAVSFDDDTSSFGGLIQDGGSGALSLTKSGTGALELTGNNTYTGGTMIEGGALIALNYCGSATGPGSIMISGGGTLQIGDGGTAGSVDGDITFTCDGGSVVFERCDTLSYGGVISGDGSVTTSGSGEIILTGANTYTGGTFVNAGTLTVGATDTLPTDGAVTVAEDATLDVENDQTIAALNGDSGASLLLAACERLTISGADDLGQFDGTISGDGKLSVTGGGTLTLTGNNTYTGGTKIDASTLIALNWCGSATGTDAIKILGDGTLQIGDGGSKGSVDGDIMFTCDGGSVVFERCDTLTYGGVISGDGSVTTSGSGEIILTGANTYTGGTFVNAGTLTVGAIDTLPTDGAVTVAEGATFNLANDQTIASLNGDCGASTFLSACQTLTISGSDDLGEFDGTISGDGKLSVMGGGTLTLTGNNTYAGGTTVDESTLIALNYCGSATGSGNITITGDGTLQIGDGGTKGGVDGDITFGSDGGSVVFERCDMLTYGGVISGNGSVTTSASGEIVLTGANTYTGGTFVQDGTLTVGAVDTLPTAGTVTVADGATFNAANNQTIGKICADEGSMTLLGYCKTLTVSGCNNLGHVDGTISGGGALTVTGGGYLTLTGDNTYCGGTTIDGATLIAANDRGSATGSGTVTVTSGGVLGGRGSIGGSLVLNCGATVAPGIEKTLTSTCANAPGTLSVGTDATFGGDATFAFHIDDANGSAGYAMDLLTISGGLTLNATEGNPFVIDLYSLNSCDLPGCLTNFDAAQSYSWTFVTVDGAISGFDPAAFSVTTGNFYNSFSGSFGVAQSGGELLLQYTPAAVPEPSTWMLLIAGGAVLGVGMWRRRRAVR